MRKILALPRRNKINRACVERKAYRAFIGTAGSGARSRPHLSSVSEVAQEQGGPAIDQKADATELDFLYAALSQVTAATNPRTFKMLGSTNRKISQKVIEEAGEVALEAIRHRNRGVVRESADLLYHLIVLWRRAGIDPSQIWAEMHQRATAFGLAEKRPKSQRAPKSHSII